MLFVNPVWIEKKREVSFCPAGVELVVLENLANCGSHKNMYVAFTTTANIEGSILFLFCDPLILLSAGPYGKNQKLACL